MSTYESERTDEAWHLLRKVFLLFLVVIAAALGLVLLSRQKSTVPLILFNILADAGLGLLAGLATRLVLKDRHGLVQGLVSTAVAYIGLAVLGYFTNWRSGIGPFQVGLVRVHWLDAARIPLQLPLEFGHSGMDLLDLVHMVIAMDTSWIALRVWKQGPRVSGQGSLPSSEPRVRRPAPPRPSQSVAPQPAPLPPPYIPASSGPSARPKLQRKKSGRPMITKAAPAIRPMRAAKPRKAPLRMGRSAVHLAVYEEHRCPYCLEPVDRNDPRGTVECQVCHTLHHKDCWDITGSCQVPHLNT